MVHVSKINLILELADSIDNHPSLVKITNKEEEFVVPDDRYEDFLHDIKLMFGRIVQRVSETK